ncbi:MAG: TrmO family methyltransferase [Spirochaetes bacterium]|nr:TrmO family methyltransferase [Spirochaetota bacterium]
MSNMSINAIGKIKKTEQGFAIHLENQYKEGLIGLQGYSHLNIFWWANQMDEPEYRQILVIDKPYTNGPDKIGIFATRSPLRPNPIALTAVFINEIDYKKGILYTPFIDADPDTPVLDIKPYLPSTDIVKDLQVPQWCQHWPTSIEDSANFSWENEFNF